MHNRYSPTNRNRVLNNRRHQLKYLQKLCTFIFIALNVSYKTIVNGAKNYSKICISRHLAYSESTKLSRRTLSTKYFTSSFEKIIATKFQ